MGVIWVNCGGRLPKMNANLLDLLHKIANTPNAPYLYSASRDLIKQILVNAQIPELSIGQDEFALYARVKRGNPKKQLIVTTHIDHPAIVLKNSKYGIAFGSVGYERISQNLSSSPIPVKIYDSTGIFQQLAHVHHFAIKRGIPIVSINASKPVLSNSHAIWDVPPIEQNNGVIKMQNADNGAVTAVALQLLIDSTEFNDIDLQVVFVYVEEVHQIASTGIAERGSTPFGKIDKDTIVINLEAMEVEISDIEKGLIQELNLPCPKYDGGVLIKVNDGQLVYGFQFPKIENQAELLVKHVAEIENINHQYTISTGSTDAKSFSLFPLTPHIVTLAVPCRWKHNHGANGEFIPEEIHEQDLYNTLAILKLAVNKASSVSSQRILFSLSHELKKRNYGLSSKQADELRKQRSRLMKAAQPRLKKEKYFDSTLLEFFEFNYWRVASKFVSLKAKSGLTKRAPDVWDSAASQAESTPKQNPAPKQSLRPPTRR
jgi:hypothetical protein